MHLIWFGGSLIEIEMSIGNTISRSMGVGRARGLTATARYGCVVSHHLNNGHTVLFPLALYILVSLITLVNENGSQQLRAELAHHGVADARPPQGGNETGVVTSQA